MIVRICQIAATSGLLWAAYAAWTAARAYASQKAPRYEGRIETPQEHSAESTSADSPPRVLPSDFD